MNVTALLSQLEEHEGFRSSAYVDSEGFWTIGVGRLIDARRGGGISKAEALFLLQNDVEKVETQLDAHVPWWRRLDDVRQRVLADMAFNLGINGLLGFKNTLASVEAGRYASAADGMLESKWASQVGRRAHRLARMMRTGADA